MKSTNRHVMKSSYVNLVSSSRLAMGALEAQMMVQAKPSMGNVPVVM
jgi:hypothetical protein